MTGTTDALVLDLVEWVAREPRLYSEVIETWRTSCPRLTIWEDAVDRGYVTRQPPPVEGVRIAITDARRETPARQPAADPARTAGHTNFRECVPAVFRRSPNAIMAVGTIFYYH